ncbi:cystinosin homolog isoform X2 [Neltuma alba]|uniref:cystinosin homolog isoform X2 n=1 Tax=Neltuma alba TaxID=207710 RepID=UPI0010A4F344|nr:cystinosin homolog isoform X2 [Prosopis alba]
MEGVSWKSPILEGAYDVCGWLAFIFWSGCLYPQLFLNFRRKSVVGLNFNYALMNNTKHTVYFIYNACFYFSPQVQSQYRSKYGLRQMIPVAANDVALSFHSVVLTLLTLFQIAIYDRGNQAVSKFTIIMLVGVWLGVVVCYFVALPSHSWLWFLSVLTSIQVCMTSIKYIPQALMNCLRRSTEGFSIGYVLLDFSGGTLNYAQMIMQSIDQNSWVNLYGNIGKVLLSLVSMSFDVVFMCQHYLLYPSKKESHSSKLDQEIAEPLVTDGDISAVTIPHKSPTTHAVKTV